MKPLFEGSEWDFETIEKVWKEIEIIARDDFGLDYYEPQIEMISSEQMLDAYSSVAMPIMYNHWSFGKSFIENKQAYDAGHLGLAYEVVINTNPCIAYLMEDNTMTMQTLVLAHAVCGHGGFFKNNYLFKQWTDADFILPYLKFAKNYIRECEDKYGAEEVELTLDACHSLQNYGVDKYKRPPNLKDELLEQRTKKWKEYSEQMFNDIWKTVPGNKNLRKQVETVISKLAKDPRSLPEENILYFLEKNSPILETWQREIIRIVRKIAQYFYPQMQTKMMNEGWASFVHYQIMHRLYDKGIIGDGSMLEFLESHSGVVYQRAYTRLNPYYLGFSMFMDLKRICENPTDEDREHFPDIVDTDPWKTLPEIMANYRDESFILQYLSPKLIRDMKLFSILDSSESNYYQVQGTHELEYVEHIRGALAKQYDISHIIPKLEVVGVDWDDTRVLKLRHTKINENDRELELLDTHLVLNYLEYLWSIGKVDMESD